MTRTVAAVKAHFEAEGITFKEWAKDNGYNPRTVYAVLSGDLKCSRGVTHKIAVDLGLKEKPQGGLRAA